MSINLNSYEEAKNMCQKFVDNEDFSENVRMMASLNFTLLSACEELNNINKNLEKIANNTEKAEITQETPTFHIGEHFDFKTNEYEGFETIICNQNKDSYVDKNIILD